jgi:hypothetical protein
LAKNTIIDGTGNIVRSSQVELQFTGAGVTVAADTSRPDRAVVTIAGAPPPVSSGWVDDGAIVRLSDPTDSVVIGDSAVSGGGEKLRVVGSSLLDGDVIVRKLADVALGPEIHLQLRRTLVGPLGQGGDRDGLIAFDGFDGAGVLRTWAGLAGVTDTLANHGRLDFLLQAGLGNLARVLEIHPASLGDADTGVILRSRASGGVPPFTMRVNADYAGGQVVLSVEDNDGGGGLFKVDGAGVVTIGTDLLPSANDSGNVGTDVTKWARVRATAVVTGDLELRNDEEGAHWIIRERPDGIEAFNVKTQKTYQIGLSE